MGADRFIARRLRFKERMAVVAIALSSCVIILAVSISSGFRSEIRRGISDMAGDVIISDQNVDYLSDRDPMELDENQLAAVRLLPGVEDLRPVVYRAGIVKSGRSIKGVLFKGVESRDSSMYADIPSALASGLGLECGDDMLVYFVGDRIQMRRFKVARIQDNPIDTGDGLVVHVPIGDLQRLNGWSDDEVSAIELVAEEQYRGRRELRALAGQAGMVCPYICIPSSEKYSRLHDWLELIDFNVLVILLLMTIVAGFNMISGLLIFLFRKTSTIGILKSMGMGNRNLGRLFLRVAARKAALGMLIGNVLALAFCTVQDCTHLIKLDAANYFVSFVPVKVNIPIILAADLISFAAIMLMMLLPVLFIARVDPARTVKSE